MLSMYCKLKYLTLVCITTTQTSPCASNLTWFRGLKYTINYALILFLWFKLTIVLAISHFILIHCLKHTIIYKIHISYSLV